LTEVAAAPLGRATRILTVIALAIIGAVLAAVLSAGTDEPLAPRLIIATVLAAVVLASWALAPKGYATAPGRLVVRRRGARPRTYATRPELPVRWRMRGLRLLGSGGLFGHFGTFWTRGLGRYKAHVTDPARTVLVTTAQGPVLISPADPETFLASCVGPDS